PTSPGEWCATTAANGSPMAVLTGGGVGPVGCGGRRAGTVGTAPDPGDRRGGGPVRYVPQDLHLATESPDQRRLRHQLRWIVPALDVHLRADRLDQRGGRVFFEHR